MARGKERAKNKNPLQGLRDSHPSAPTMRAGFKPSGIQLELYGCAVLAYKSQSTHTPAPHSCWRARAIKKTTQNKRHGKIYATASPSNTNEGSRSRIYGLYVLSSTPLEPLLPAEADLLPVSAPPPTPSSPRPPSASIRFACSAILSLV